MVNNKNDTWIPSAIPFFSFGVFFYLVSPAITLNFVTDSILVNAARNFISSEYFNIYYWLDVIIISVSWLLGYVWARRVTRKKSHFLNSVSLYRLAPRIIFLLLFATLLLLIFRSMAMGAVFFSGYETYDISILGPFATMVFTSAFFLNYFSIPKYKKLFFFLFLTSAIILLGFGSRMFFLLGFITVLLGFLSNNRKYLTNIGLYITLGLVFLFILSVGIWRSENVAVSFENLFGILFAEPLFTAVSGAQYLENIRVRPVTNWPTDIVASFINFIPSIFFPGKVDALTRLTANPYKFSPFGAHSIIVNIYSNFGYFYPLFIFLIGWFYGFIRTKAVKSLFARTVYLTILPILMFHFFREGYITVIKIIFFNGFILPYIILLMLKTMLTKR